MAKKKNTFRNFENLLTKVILGITVLFLLLLTASACAEEALPIGGPAPYKPLPGAYSEDHRIYDDGSIRVESCDLRDATRASLRASFGMVLQDTWLRAATVRENICMARPDATEEEMLAAAKASHAHSFIKRLPNGYDTLLGEGGGSLSQGQKQLLCITRVMLALPPMLILDEATSSIDTRMELKIQNAFARMMQGRTSFIVAHRLSTIESADVILVMKDGKVIEQGDHRTLLAKKGFYHKIYTSQYAI